MKQRVTIEFTVDTSTRQTVAALVDNLERIIREEVSRSATLSFGLHRRPVHVEVDDQSEGL